MAQVKRAGWLAWLTFPMALLLFAGAISAIVAGFAASVALMAWAVGAKPVAAFVLLLGGLPMGLVVAIANAYWTDQRREQLRKVGL